MELTGIVGQMELMELTGVVDEIELT